MVRKDEDEELSRSRRDIARIPRWALPWMLRLTRFLAYQLNLDLRAAGLPRDPFGSAMVTSMGMLGVETAFAPLYPMGGPPILVTVGAVKKRPVVDEDSGEIVARETLRLAGTFDHRLMDGYHLAKLSADLRKILEQEIDLL